MGQIKFYERTEEQSRNGGVGGVGHLWLDRSELTGTELEQALGRPLYLFWPGYLDQEVPGKESFYKV